MSLWSKYDLLSAFFYLSSLLICGHSYLFSIAQLKESITLFCVLIFDLLSLLKSSEFATSSSRPPLFTSGGFWTISLSITLYCLCWSKLMSLWNRIRRSASAKSTVFKVRDCQLWTIQASHIPASLTTGKRILWRVRKSIMVPSLASI